MAISLKKTDVVIVGPGRRPAAWRPCRSRSAGLEVIGLEAGTVATRPPTSHRTSCATTSAAGRRPCRKRIARSPRIGRTAPRRTPRGRPIHPMMNAVGGTTLHYWAQSWRLNPWDFKVVSETTRRYGASRIPQGLNRRRLAVRPRGARAVLRPGRARDRRLGKGGQHQWHDRRARQYLRRGRGAREYPMPPLRGTGFTEMMADAARTVGWHPFAGPAAINSRSVSGPRRLRVPRLLQSRRLPRKRQGIDGGDHDSQGATTGTPEGGHRGAR